MKEDFEMMEKIDAWLSGKMDRDDSIKFEEEISNSPELGAEVENQKMADLLVLGNRLNQIKQQMDQDFRDGKVGKTAEKQLPFKGITGMLIILLISGTAAYFLLKQPQNKTTAIEKQSEIPQNSGKISNIKGTGAIPASSGNLSEKPSHTSELNATDKKTDFQELPVPAGSGNTITSLADENSAVVVIACSTVSVEEPQLTYTPDSEAKKTEIISEKTKEIKEEKTEDSHPSEKESDSFSFNPGYQEVFNIPMNKGPEAEFTVLDRSGKVIWRERIYQDRINTWDGRNLEGGISRPDLYIYCLDYTNGKKARGQVIIY
jgi:hypothetical protein